MSDEKKDNEVYIKSLMASSHNLIAAIHNKQWERLPGLVQYHELSLKWLKESRGERFDPHEKSTLTAGKGKNRTATLVPPVPDQNPLWEPTVVAGSKAILKDFVEYKSKMAKLLNEKSERIAELESQLRQGHADTWNAAIYAFGDAVDIQGPANIDGEKIIKAKTEYLNKLFPKGI